MRHVRFLLRSVGYAAVFCLIASGAATTAALAFALVTRQGTPLVMAIFGPAALGMGLAALRARDQAGASPLR